MSIGVALIFGAGNFTVTIGTFSIGGIGTATLAAIVLYQLLGLGSRQGVRVHDCVAAHEAASD